MHEYRIRFSYMDGDERTYEYDYFVCTTLRELSEFFADDYDGLPGLRIERIWIDRNNSWEVIEWDD